MTPYQIEIMLHYNCSSAPFARAGAPIFRETVMGLIDDNLLRIEEGGIYRTTARGRKFVEMLCHTPLPVDGGWVDPRFAP